MSFPKFEHSMPDTPEEAGAYELLLSFLDQQRRESSTPKVFSTSRMFDVAGGVPSFALARALSHLVAKGVVRLLVRVEPNYGEGIADFDSIEEVPDEVEDWRHPGNVIKVQPEHLQIYYRLAPAAPQK